MNNTVRERPVRYHALAEPPLTDLKRKSVRGAFATLSAQGLKFVVQTAAMMVLARLLSPEDFGLQGMVVVITGFLNFFQDAGLVMATVQRSEITHEQTSTLFWINLALGVVLAMLCASSAPLLARFYHEPRLYWITVVSGTAFVFAGLAAQHGALLRRSLRFGTQAKIGAVTPIVGCAAGVVMAWLGCGYWSLVGVTLANSIANTAAVWWSVRWLPGPPRRGSGVRSMLRFGWLATCNNFVVFVAWNAEKILLGRFCGADALGLYGRAYQLVTMPVQQFESSIASVAFPALSRIQHEPERLAKSFLKTYNLHIALTIPVTIISALFADEIVDIVLGPKWAAAAPIFRLLAPVAVVFAVANPLSWLVSSRGLMGRALGISSGVTPLVILGIVLGLSHGPEGVAVGYSSAMMLVIIPIAAWSKRGTAVTWADLWRAAKGPIVSGLVAGAVGLLLKLTLSARLPLIPYLFLAVGLVLGVYAWILLIVMNQKHIYIELASHLLPRFGLSQEKSVSEG
jgi:O-antigen/teichoic acid export membrane protein